jgi:ketosteroid isomerase-like protein
MKRFIITAAVSLVCLLLSFSPGILLTSMAQTGKTDTLAKKPQAALNRERTLAVYKGIETGDLSVMDKFVAEDVIDHGGMEDVKGRENVKKMLADIHNHYTNLRFTLISDATSEDGMYHFALVRMTGTSKEAHMGMPANTLLDRINVGVARIQNGKVTEHWGFDDPREMMKMMKK